MFTSSTFVVSFLVIGFNCLKINQASVNEAQLKCNISNIVGVKPRTLVRSLMHGLCGLHFVVLSLELERETWMTE